MTSDGRQSLKRVRGAWDAIAIEPEADIVQSGIPQLISMHADMKVYNLLVGNNESFTIEKYTMADPEEKPPG